MSQLATIVEVHNLIVFNSEVTDSKDNARLTKSVIETTPINLAIMKTEPIPEPLTTLNTHDSKRTGV